MSGSADFNIIAVNKKVSAIVVRARATDWKVRRAMLEHILFSAVAILILGYFVSAFVD